MNLSEATEHSELEKESTYNAVRKSVSTIGLTPNIHFPNVREARSFTGVLDELKVPSSKQSQYHVSLLPVHLLTRKFNPSCF